MISNGPFVAEGVAENARGRPLVSGVAARTIVEIDQGRVRPWLKPGQLGPVGGLFGMAVDRRHGRLWVAEAFGHVAPGQSGPVRNAILEVELTSGRLLARHPLAADARERTLGDVTVTDDGSIFASDSTGGGLFRLPPGGGELGLFIQTALKSPQGLVPSRDGKALLLLDYASGLHRVDLGTGAVTQLEGDGARLRGLDALVRNGADLIATRNGGSPNRVLRLRLSADEKAVRSVETLAEDPARFDDISLGTVIGRRFVFVAHSQWSAVGADGRIADAPAPARLEALALHPPNWREARRQPAMQAPAQATP